jgi:streptogramin lyase
VTEPNNCKSVQTTSPSQPPPTANYAGTNFAGTVRAGAVPIIGASVQLYAAGNSGNGSAPVALLNAPLTTDSNGVFSVTASFTCPYSNSILYIVSRGGQAGASAAVNAGTVLVAMLGPCSTLKSSLNIVVDEATTVAAAWSMAQFLSAGAQIGVSATNNSGLTLAAATAANLVNLETGTAPSANFPATGVAPLAKIDTLANVLNACITSTGASSAACTQLYAATTTSRGAPSNTFDASMNLVRQPGNNVAAISTLAAASSAYTPALGEAPADWTLFVTYSGGGMNGPSAVSIDSQGNVWVANYFAVASLFSNTGVPAFPSGLTGYSLLNSYGGAVDGNDTMWVANEQSTSGLNGNLGSLTLLDASGNSPAVYSSGGINFPLAVAFDTSGVAWIADYGNSHVTVLDSSGVPLSGASGYTAKNLQFPVAIATDSKCNAYVANQSTDTITQVLADGSGFNDFVTGSGASGLAIDAADNVWVANYYANTVGLVSAAGKVLSGAGFATSSLIQPQGIAVDAAGNAWVASYHGSSLTELSSVSSASPGATLSPSAGWAPDSELLEPYAVAIDAGGNIWVSNFGSDTLTEFVGLAAPVKTPQLGPVRSP